MWPKCQQIGQPKRARNVSEREKEQRPTTELFISALCEPRNHGDCFSLWPAGSLSSLGIAVVWC